MMAGSEHKSWKINEQTGYEECDTVWPAIIQSRIYPDSIMYSRASTGSSNFGIARRTIKHVTDILKTYKPEQILVCIMWTSMFRKEYRIEYEQNANKHKNNDEWNYVTTLPTDNLISLGQSPSGKLADNNQRKMFLRRNNLLEVANSYYKNINIPISFTLESFSQIEYVNLFLDLHKIKSIQCFGFNDHFLYEQYKNTDVYTESIKDRLKKYKIYTIENNGILGFYEYSKKYHKLGPGLHPLENAHKEWSRHMMRLLK